MRKRLLIVGLFDCNRFPSRLADEWEIDSHTRRSVSESTTTHRRYRNIYGTIPQMSSTPLEDLYFLKTRLYDMMKQPNASPYSIFLYIQWVIFLKCYRVKDSRYVLCGKKESV